MGCYEINSFFVKNSDRHLHNLVMLDKPINRISMKSENNMK